MLFSNAYLTLLIGPTVPVPAPLPVIEALQSIQVTNSANENGFQLTFTVGKLSPLQTTLLPAGFFDPIITRVVIMVTLNGVPNVIIDGFVTRQDLQPSNESGQSTLTITGKDITVVMNLLETIIPYPNMSDDAQVRLILKKYALLGVVDIVLPPFIPTVRTATDCFDTQNGTDLAYIRSLARRNGYVFYIESGPLPGQSLAYFGPKVRNPVPQSALSVNMDAHTNVDSLSFNAEGLNKEVEITNILDPITGRIPIPVPIPDLNVFEPPLTLRPLAPAKVSFNRDSAGMLLTEAVRQAVANGVDSESTTKASGSLDVMQYGKILKSRALVGVRGAGVTYDGLYHVDSVTHNIKQGEYKQSFSLSRDGLIANTPVVNP